MEKEAQYGAARASIAYRAAALAVGTLYRLGDYDPHIPLRLTSSGLNNLPHNEPYILAYAHHNSWDIPTLGTVVHRSTRRPVHFMAKYELLEDGSRWGRLLNAMHALPVQRGQTTREQIRNAIDVLEQGEILGIAAEGGRIDGDRVGDIQGGAGYIATHANVETVPVGVAGVNWRFRGRNLPYVPRSIHIHFSKPIIPLGPTRQDREEVNQQIAASLQASLDQSYHYYGMIHGKKASSRLDTGLTKLF
ncbi:1-acyl-sn-glycerol-3-phosphate acyltransferase [Candidatus Saccharibacteria bacterium]|nr:1-acyl-sn-glycerol-3-phosphate acyltransferase [Candidatus Saccharibacteria bacterium]MBI2285476.1 1-acyl-sn-glycerol-3-phosphate acyltransferase [Candidatus Saccharibacteria bacterium]